jgi:hypothetical protein
MNGVNENMFSNAENEFSNAENINAEFSEFSENSQKPQKIIYLSSDFSFLMLF